MALDPMAAMITVALLQHKPEHTKVAIRDMYLEIQEPGWGQSIVRRVYGDTQDDLTPLSDTFSLAHAQYKDEKCKFIFDEAVKGLEALKKTYKKRATENSAEKWIKILKGEEEGQKQSEVTPLAEKIKQFWDDQTIGEISEWFEEAKEEGNVRAAQKIEALLHLRNIQFEEMCEKAKKEIEKLM